MAHDSAARAAAPDGPPRAAIVFTGFEPFGACAVNPSWDVARIAAEASDIPARADLLPVTFRAAAEYGATVLADPGAPAALIHVGLSGDRNWISLERFGRNASGDGKDNDGASRPGRLVADGPELLETGFDLDALAAGLAADTGREVRVSDSAGAYVCNAIYYHSLRHARDARVLFVHVPMMDEVESRSVGETLARCVARAMETP